jgi:hypothetical protein
MYSFLPTDLTTLDPPSLLDFRSAVKTFDKLERLRRDEEAKVCHLLISSFSEEAKMLLRSVPAFVAAFNDNDSFAMYRIAKESHTCASSFAVAQSTFHQLLSIKKTGTFAALTDTLLNHRRTFADIFETAPWSANTSCPGGFTSVSKRGENALGASCLKLKVRMGARGIRVQGGGV